MPSFDVVSKLDLHELTNAIDQANRELANRFDFKGSDAVFERSEETVVTLKAGQIEPVRAARSTFGVPMESTTKPRFSRTLRCGHSARS